MRPTGEPVPPWALEPKSVWVYLGLILALLIFVSVLPVSESAFEGLLLLVTLPVFIVNLLMIWFTYADRKARSLPAFWWPFAVGCFGPFGYLFYVYSRREGGSDEALSSPPPGQVAHGSAHSSPDVLAHEHGDSPTPPGWYADRLRPGNQRYWGGTDWTEYRSGHQTGAPKGYYPAPDGSPSWLYWDGGRWITETDRPNVEGKDDPLTQDTTKAAGGGGAEESATPKTDERNAAPSLAVELERLSELHQRGSLSDTEFAEAKQALIRNSAQS